jgi:CHU_C Type IX secretion signal domain
MKFFFAPLLFLVSISMFSCGRTDDSIPPPRLTNCDGLISDTANTNDNARIFMPSAFTCNGDGKNDLIRPTFRNASSISFTLYDLFNNIVFTSTQAGQGWAAPAPSLNGYSVYYYKIQITTISNKKIGICGEVYNFTCYPSNIPRSNIFFEDQLRTNGFTGTTTETLATCP